MRLSSTLISLSILIHKQILVQVYGDDFICQNNGFLMTGVKRYSDVFTADMIDTLPFFDTESINGNYCQCMDGYPGYTGVDCAVSYEICEDNSICFHGAPCVQDLEKETYLGTYHCACPQTTDPVKQYEGKSCEYEVTSYCDTSYPTDNDTVPGDAGKYTRDSFDFSSGGKWYCTNGADCQTGVMRPSEKCDCTNGFYGLHCELRDEPICELKCDNGGICKNGVKDYTNLSNSLQEHFEPDAEYDTHCICPTGFTGWQCEDDISICGTGHCLNGGVCTPGGCDCTEASKINPQNGYILAYAGTSCESEVTSFCPVPSGFDRMSHFCTNGGKCPEDYADNFSACECDRDHIGPRCEFTIQNTQVCDLECDNGGTCFFGETSDQSDKPLVEHNKDDQMHCKCPDGYIGDLCSIDICGLNKHYCMNDGKCIENNDSYTCECAQTDKSGIYAGANCEYAASIICGTGTSENGILSFCTNEGTCKRIVGEVGVHPGCECNDEYRGQYCEILKSEKDSKITGSMLWINGKTFWICLAIFLAIFILFYFIVRCFRSRKNNTRKHTPIDNHTEVNDPENSDNNITDMEEIHVEDYNPYDDDDGEIVLNVQIT